MLVLYHYTLLLSKMNANTKYSNSNSIYINFLVHYEKIIQKYIKTWDRIKNLLGEKFDSDTIYNNVYIGS